MVAEGFEDVRLGDDAMDMERLSRLYLGGAESWRLMRKGKEGEEMRIRNLIENDGQVKGFGRCY